MLQVICYKFQFLGGKFQVSGSSMHQTQNTMISARTLLDYARPFGTKSRLFLPRITIMSRTATMPMKLEVSLDARYMISRIDPMSL